ncbi:MAG: peptidylprolyl isomerase [Caulobacter sp. 12-67-6]|nr:MAG: peptidylprolyl isomerase [Caulobacter sp. 12-67-6]OYX69985.1 MAG: peptidylprolyl isomerase [Caulobacter sp. 32-67-35]OYX96602.1 MAG: peptidylprolyl isomerase [Caulobacter sp. 35-67-4]OZA75646.1 MAG: peptidylprolyl isomerase [Caulobacter sp. 39-67-4]HQR89287.1 peptidylprolyl isomerase [Caulobacter sp.]
MNNAWIARRSLLGGAGLLLASPLGAQAQTAKPRVAIQTSHGVIVVELEDKKAPITSANFLRYVDKKKFDGGSFYRASRARGAPEKGSIQGGPSYRTRRFAPIAHESTRLTGIRHKAGAISMARNEPGSATADFFICASPMAYLDARPGAPGDNQGFAAFGTVVKGMDVVRKILASKTDGVPQNPSMKGQMINPPVAMVSVRRV